MFSVSFSSLHCTDWYTNQQSCNNDKKGIFYCNSGSTALSAQIFWAARLYHGSDVTHLIKVFRTGNPNTKVADKPIFQAIDPAMNINLLPSTPGIINSTRAAERPDLVNHIELAKPRLRCFGRQGFQLSLVLGRQTANATEPVGNNALGRAF